MTDKRTKKLALLAILAALTFVLGRFVQIPIPAVNGYVTLLDAGIFTVAFAFGNKEALVVGGVAAFLSDFTSGFPQWMLFSLVIHGLQGFTGNLILTKNKTADYLLSWLISGTIMVAGYFFATWILYGYVTAINPLTNIPNMIQTTVGYIIGLTVAQLLKKSGALNGLS